MVAGIRAKGENLIVGNSQKRKKNQGMRQGNSHKSEDPC